MCFGDFFFFMNYHLYSYEDFFLPLFLVTTSDFWLQRTVFLPLDTVMKELSIKVSHPPFTSARLISYAVLFWDLIPDWKQLIFSIMLATSHRECPLVSALVPSPRPILQLSFKITPYLSIFLTCLFNKLLVLLKLARVLLLLATKDPNWHLGSQGNLAGWLH